MKSVCTEQLTLNKKATLIKQALKGKTWLLSGLANITKGILDGKINNKSLLKGLRMKTTATGFMEPDPSRELGTWLQLHLNYRPAASLFKNRFTVFKNALSSPGPQLPCKPNSLLQQEINKLYSAIKAGKYIPTSLKQAYQNIYNILKRN